MPTSRIAAISSVVATGRRMKGRDGLMSGAGQRFRGSPAVLLLAVALAAV